MNIICQRSHLSHGSNLSRYFHLFVFLIVLIYLPFESFPSTSLICIHLSSLSFLLINLFLIVIMPLSYFFSMPLCPAFYLSPFLTSLPHSHLFLISLPRRRHFSFSSLSTLFPSSISLFFSCLVFSSSNYCYLSSFLNVLYSFFLVVLKYISTYKILM